VDCEGWDIFAVMSGEVGRDREPERKPKKRQRVKRNGDRGSTTRTRDRGA
jgi:hypothetical protein